MTQRDDPPQSQVGGTQHTEPEGATPAIYPESEPEKPSAEKWECLTCGNTYDEDLGNCPRDGAPLRKIGADAAPTGPQSFNPIAGSQDNIERPPSSLEETTGGSVKGSPMAEETDMGMLSGERPSAPDPGRGMGESAG